MLINISAPIALEANRCDSFINELINWSSQDSSLIWGITYGQYWTIITLFVLEFIVYYLVIGFISIYTNISPKWKKILYWYKIIITFVLIIAYFILVNIKLGISFID